MAQAIQLPGPVAQNQGILPSLSQSTDILLRLAKSTSRVCKNFLVLRKKASFIGNGISIVMDVKNIAEGTNVAENVSKLFFDTVFMVGKIYFSRGEKIANSSKKLAFAVWDFSSAVGQNNMSKAINKTVEASKEVLKLMLLTLVSVEITLVLYLISDITLCVLNGIKHFGKINRDGTYVIETGENVLHVAIKGAKFCSKYFACLA